MAHLIPLVLLHALGQLEQGVPLDGQPGFPVDGLAVADLQLQPGHGRLVGGEHNALQTQVAVRSPQVLDLEALDLDSLDQPLVVRVQGVQGVDQLMVLLVGGGVVQAEQGGKLL